MADSITGRDLYVVCKALAYAIITIEQRPVEYREQSDCNDMKKLLEHYGSQLIGAGYYIDNARRHIDGDRFNDSNVIDLMNALKSEVEDQ